MLLKLSSMYHKVTASNTYCSNNLRGLQGKELEYERADRDMSKTGL